MANAANQHLAGGGGVDGAIHRAGGRNIMDELKARYAGCPTGSAVISGAGKLPCRHVIHAVGPRWRDGDHGEPELLTSAYRSVFELAEQHDVAHIVLPSISTGIYGFPVAQAARIALDVACGALQADATPLRRVEWVLFTAASLEAYDVALNRL